MGLSQNNTNNFANKAHDNAREATAEVSGAIRDGASTMADLREKATENAKQVLQSSMDQAAHHAREASERITRVLGFSGEDGERLAGKAKQNMEAVTQCGTVLSQAVQDASRSWIHLGQKQWQRNLDGLDKLTRSKSLQEFTAIQSELVREGLEHMVHDSRAILEKSLHAIDHAGKTFSGEIHQGSSQGH